MELLKSVLNEAVSFGYYVWTKSVSAFGTSGDT